MSDDAWEKLRHMTVDQLVTSTKLTGSAQTLKGWTTPEGYPFVIMCAVGSTEGNMGAVTVLRQAERMIRGMASWFVKVEKDPAG